MRSILDPAFRYTSSVNTDIAKTFARIRKEQKSAEAAKQAQRRQDAENTQSVINIMAQRRK